MVHLRIWLVLSSFNWLANAAQKYFPNVPAAYDQCAFDPDNRNTTFEMLDSRTGSPIVSQGGLAGLTQIINNNTGAFHFGKALERNNGTRDLILVYNKTSSFLALYRNGSIGFVPTSSRGQRFFPSDADSSEQYITSLFSIDCNGTVSTGLLHSGELQLVVSHGMIQARNKSDTSKGFQERGSVDIVHGAMTPIILLKKVGRFLNNSVDVPRCGSPNDESSVRPGARPAGTNGCGAGWMNHMADGPLLPCCDGHDLCYDDCIHSWATCNSNFDKCTTNLCNTKFKAGTFEYWRCMKLRDAYVSIVSSPVGKHYYDSSTSDRCQCTCKYQGEDPCGCDKTNYEGSPLFSEVNPYGSDQWSACKGCCTAWTEAENNGGSCVCCVFDWQYNDPTYGCCSRPLAAACCRVSCGVEADKL